MMNPLLLFYRRVLHAWETHNLRNLYLRAKEKLTERIASPAVEAVSARPEAHPFDVEHGVDTGGFVHGEALATGRAEDVYTTAYYGVSPSALTLALEYLGANGLDLSGFSFVDLGSGKGRALLVASRHPFRRIVGVELSPELCAIARVNAQAFAPEWRVCGEIAIEQADATTYDFPPTPLVIYMYHPFLGKMLRRMLRNLETNLRQQPREVYLLYANPTYDRIMAEFPFLTQLWFYRLPLSAEDAAADRHGITHENFALYHHAPAAK